ncbi:MAG: YbdK family carboxylate-amine ligase [Candidatus Brocadiaceae bacterium]|nr:YbdK family carboxylate-amine ligase [Candidatus Brocadiaceae bacterium]
MKPFKKNSFPTLGIEEEFHLIDSETADLSPSVDDVMALLDPKMRQRVCYELFQSVLESRTDVCETVDDLLHNVMEGRTVLAETCKPLKIHIVASGSHPFGDWKKQSIVDDDHYRWVFDNHQYVSRRLFAFGLHIHVGIKNEEVAIYIMNEMKRWTYPLLALSANSPFYEGMDTGLASTRTHLFHCMPRTGFAPPFSSFSELVEHYEKLLATGCITRPGDLWWIIRPQPPFGTIEYRIFDLPTSVRRIGAFAAIVQAATATYQDQFFAGKSASEMHTEYLEQNWWMAMRFGLHARIIRPDTREVISMRDQLKQLLAFVKPKAKELHTERHIEYAEIILEQGNEAEQQRSLFQQFNGDLRSLEKELAKNTMNFQQ